MTHYVLIAAWAVLALSATATSVRSQCLDASVTFTQTAPDSLLVTYVFNEPITSLRFGPPVDEYRSKAWRVVTEGLGIQRQGNDEVLVDLAGASFQRATIAVSPYSAYPPDQYVPMAHFSDGSFALYLGFFTGDTETVDGKRVLCPRYFFSTPPGHSLLLGSQAREQPKGFVYFGDLAPVDAGYARLLLDSTAPAWLDSVLGRVVAGTSELYRRGLPLSPKRPPLILVAAGELESVEGYSIKGGAVGDQIVLTLRGTDLREETPEVRAAFERLMAHEMAHLWQQAANPEDVTEPDPMITEGGCEALAVRALQAAGIWTSQQGDAFTKRARAGCPQHELGAQPQPHLVREIEGVDPYACGYVLFVDSGMDPFTVWSEMLTRVRKSKEGFTRTLFDEVTGASR